MMKGVRFGDYHSYDDLRLILTEKEIEAPEPKLQYVEIPGRDGKIDFTDAYGGVRYSNRTLSFSFQCIEPYDDFLRLFSEIQNRLHGRRLKVVLDDDPAFYYVGRVSVDSWRADKRIGEIGVEVDADPYKYAIFPTVMEHTIAETGTVYLPNLRREVTPLVSCSAPMDISFDGQSFHFEAGDEQTSSLVLKEGTNILTVSGTGTIRFEYQEATL